MLQAFWQANRPFILRVAAGLAVFLILMNIALGYRVDGQRQISKAKTDLIGTKEKLEQLDGRHEQEQRNAKALEKRGEDFLEKLSLSQRMQAEPPPGGDTQARIDFPRKKAEFWSKFQDQADRINLGYPQSRDVSFDERGDLTTEEWADRYATLEVLRRVFEAGVDAQIDRFISINPEPLVTEMIRDDPDLSLYRYPISLRIEASYSEVLTFVRSFQGNANFLSIELLEVVPSDRTKGAVEATLKAVGIDIGAVREVVKKPSGRRVGGRGGF